MPVVVPIIAKKTTEKVIDILGCDEKSFSWLRRQVVFGSQVVSNELQVVRT